MLDGRDNVYFIISCLGGGTGTGVAPFIASMARELGKKTVGIVTLPFGFEGEKKYAQALDGVKAMAKFTDSMYILNNQYTFENLKDSLLLEAFKTVDNQVVEIIKSITALMFPLPYEEQPKTSIIKILINTIKNNH